jgi:hypothetical protein
MSNFKQIELEYVYVTVPADYICVYHRILALLADYGYEMLLDCKANCTDKNSGVIECFNMFNAAVAARKLGNTKLAETIIKYIKAKLNQLYKGKDNSTSFVFPVDETGHLKAVVSCGERPKFEIDSSTGELLEHKLNNGFNEHFQLDSTDVTPTYDTPISEEDDKSKGLYVEMTPRYDIIDEVATACADMNFYYDGKLLKPSAVTVDYYFDGEQVTSFLTCTNIQMNTTHTFMIVVHYKGEVDVVEKELLYAIPNN